MNNAQIADALEGLLCPNMAVGNKVIIKAAVEALRKPVDMKEIPRYAPDSDIYDNTFMTPCVRGKVLDRDQVINYLRSIGQEVTNDAD